jgi:hypothetical protein
MDDAIRVLDIVAQTEALPGCSVRRGQVGAVVESLGPSVFEVEFSDDEGRTCAMAAVGAEQLMVLHHRPIEPTLDRTIATVRTVARSIRVTNMVTRAAERGLPVSVILRAAKDPGSRLPYQRRTSRKGRLLGRRWMIADYFGRD